MPPSLQRVDGPTTVYILILDDVERWLGATPLVPPRSDLLKVGFSNDVQRRLGELNAGPPKVIGLRWRRLWITQLLSGADAFAAEQEVPRLVHERGWSGAGEFVIAPAGALQARIRAVLRALVTRPLQTLRR